MANLPVTGDPDADAFLDEDPLGLLLGMLLDQQVTMEAAFAAPARLRDRLDGPFTAATIAALDDDAVEALFRQRPPLHRYPASMGKRTRDLCRALVEHHGGEARAVWDGASSGGDLLARLQALPGFGEEKSRIFVAVLAKRFGIRPEGWEAAAGPFADGTRMSVADVDSPESLQAVRAWKREHKAAQKRS